MNTRTKGRSDYLELGSYNAQCYRCGAKRKASVMKKQWQGFWVCPEHWEPRQPQDFVKGVQENMAVPWSQPEPAPIFVPVCTLLGSQAIPGFAIPGCVMPSTYNPVIVFNGTGII